MREKVQTYFKVQLDQYLDWLDRRGLSKGALACAREEMLDHESNMDLDSAAAMWLPIARFKSKMDVSDADWDASMPRIATELRKGRRDMLRRVLEAVQRLEHYSYDDALLQPPSPPTAPPEALLAGSSLGAAVDDFMAEHSRQWTEKTVGQNRAYLNILIE